LGAQKEKGGIDPQGDIRDIAEHLHPICHAQGSKPSGFGFRRFFLSMMGYQSVSFHVVTLAEGRPFSIAEQ
jgi:hypothetical protein